MATPPVKPRRLKGHNGTVTCCIASRFRPGVIASSGEDSCICWFDLRCKDALFTIDLGMESISCLCFKTGNEDILYASLGTKVMCFDIKMISFSMKSDFLAAGDDSGEVKIIDTVHQSLYKTLRSVHTSVSFICSSVQFIPWKPWTVDKTIPLKFIIYLAAITGGLDMKLAIWDFSKGRPYNVIDYGMTEPDSSISTGNAGQCFNPAFVHSIAIPEVDITCGPNKVCAVARGDGVIDVIDLEASLATLKSKSSSLAKSAQRSKRGEAQSSNTHADYQNKSTQLDFSSGGHTASVSCVSFSLFGERGKFLLSGGNDASVKLWDWSKCFSPEQSSCNNYLSLSINLKKKVKDLEYSSINWLCTTPTDSENLLVCDTTKVVKIYTVA
ncbi:hypothetical protein ZIOFF_008416 [Zingiber officinale]|uniref:Transducin/WD40 repeat-like superfamily protein n=1 Tax=Zingiber officinale TaxID=94328 RepID=A0A8J5HSM1_ZINOF|nr:hypothetical protein ZIOFF_008416 [Zingiber officinale]